MVNNQQPTGRREYEKMVSQRVKLLKNIYGFETIPERILREVAVELQKENFAAGSAIVRENDIGDCLYIILRGKAEVTIIKGNKEVELSGLGEGEFFGEIALLDSARQRRATVTAVTAVEVLTMSNATFNRLIQHSQMAETWFTETKKKKLLVSFLKKASPFTTLSSERLIWLSKQLESLSVNVGDTIIRQGDMGDACYLIESGKVGVYVSEEDSPEERQIATMNYSAMFGEVALLTGAPRSATIRALEPTKLLVLHRDDLLVAISSDLDVGKQVMQLLQFRVRPLRIDGVLVYEQTNAEGEKIWILKNPQQATYYRLSKQGWFIWERLDGKCTARDLAFDYMQEFQTFSPGVIAEVIMGLTAAGFIQGSSLRKEIFDNPSPGQKFLLRASRLLNWQVYISNIDGIITGLYNSGVKWLYTKWAQIVLAVIIILGIIAFIARTSQTSAIMLGTNGNPALLWFLIPGYALTIMLHEAAHAFTTKAFGREVPRAGVGWYWFSPIAFVDTSDMWLGSRRQRIVVGLAGIYCNLVLAGLASLIASFTPQIWWSVALWQLALVSYWMAIINLNPLLEYDGYHVLEDWLDKPNLRQKCLRFLGQELPKIGWNPRLLGEHKLELLYGFASLAYIGLEVSFVVILYRLSLQNWIKQFLSEEIATAITWILALVVVCISVAGVMQDLRGLQTETPRLTIE